MTPPGDRVLLQACGVRGRELFPRVSARLARAGQLTAYLAVVELELPAPRVRRWLAWTRHALDDACLEVEELREDPAVDEAIAVAGAGLRAQRGAPAEPSPVVLVTDLGAQRAARAARRALELLVRAGGDIVAHQAFGTVQTARTAICAARKEIGPSAIRTVRGRGFRITEAGLRAALQLGRFGAWGDSPDAARLPSQMSQKAAA